MEKAIPAVFVCVVAGLAVLLGSPGFGLAILVLGLAAIY